ncbi:MAG: methyltransferase domain-containing protein [Halobacteriales archaeon]|nr:methyltransferase domain-containing protein [Halobacteriales archaeon]
MGSTRAYYGIHAENWDVLRRVYYADQVTDAILARAKPGKLLDVGCGPGFLLTKALADARFTKVTGADFSDSMLRLLRARHENGHKLDLRLADAQKLPFREPSFDTVASDMVLHHLAEPWNGLAEMARVTAPGGRVVLSDLRPHTHAFFKEELADAWLGFEEQELRRWFAEAGLSDVRVEDVCTLQATVVNGKVRTVDVRVFVASGEKA